MNNGHATGRQSLNLLNVARFALAKPGAVSVMAGKIAKRLFSTKGTLSPADNLAWIKANSVNTAEFARSIDEDLWREANEFASASASEAALILDAIPFDMGAGGDQRFLYWLSRLLRPSVVVETGVSAGWTSKAFLSAIHLNGKGKLYSSDFPYFRVSNPEQYIGAVVPPHLRKNWSLRTEGDAANLPAIIAEARTIDLFHYDSDKSYAGKKATFELIQPAMAQGSIVIIDDISDDSFFYDYATGSGLPFTVFEGRFGLIGDVRQAASQTYSASVTSETPR